MTGIAAVGHALPERRVTSGELEERFGLETGWIERRTGIRERRYAAANEATSDLAIRAAADAIHQAGSLSVPVGLLLLATSTPDHLLPPTAPLVAHRLGLSGCGAIDLAGACTGFLTALALGHAHCLAQRCSVLVIGANALSRRLNPADPATSALFADGAGAMLLSPTSDAGDFLSIHLDSRGEFYEDIVVPAGGSRTPVTAQAVEDGEHWMRMARGADLYREAVRAMVRCSEIALKQAGLLAAEMDLWVPHQANARIIRDTSERLGITPGRTISVVETIGNTSAASIPIALSLANRDGRIRPGHRLLMTAVGAGMSEAAIVARWSCENRCSSRS